jgi:hypothetical protein
MDYFLHSFDIDVYLNKGYQRAQSKNLPQESI